MQQITILPIPGAAESKAIQPWAISKTTQNPQLMQRLLEMIVDSDTISGFEKAGFQVEAPSID